MNDKLVEDRIRAALEAVASDGWSGDATAVGIDEAVAAVAALLSPARDQVLEEAAKRAQSFKDYEAGAGWNAACDHVAAAIRALKGQPSPAHGVPEGWKLVPVEITEDMAVAMECEFSTEGQWRAALAAAPEPLTSAV